MTNRGGRWEVRRFDIRISSFGLPSALHAEDCAELFAEQEAHADDRHAEEDHGPDAQCAGDELAVAEQLEKLEDRLGDGIE